MLLPPHPTDLAKIMVESDAFGRKETRFPKAQLVRSGV